MEPVTYDLDTSGGLMDEIQKLIAPPLSDNPPRRRNEHREYRRPGRAVNHDCCDSCKEGGDLLCCDRCPAAFHLQCHDPPLEDEDLPTGEWICHNCKVTPMIPVPSLPEKDDDNMSTCSSTSRQSTNSQGSRTRVTKRRATIPEILANQKKALLDELDDEDEKETEHPLMMLTRAAKLMNPKQYELPSELACTTNLPGTSKTKWWVKPKYPIKKLAHELDNGIVPLPAKVCFLCSKSCRKNPLLQCDYCPLLYHMDCLNPPMASLPSGRWMCPNHAENTVDEQLLKSVSLTERVKLWDQFSGHLDQHSVKVNFLKKIHRKHPPFRLKVKHNKRKSVQIPEAIKEQYKFPPPMLPRTHDAPTTEGEAHSSPRQSDTPNTDQEQWLSSVVALQTSIARHLAQQQLNNVEIEKSTPKTTTEITKPTASVLPTVKQDLTSNSPPPSDSCNSSSTIDVKNNNKRTLMNGDVNDTAEDIMENGPCASKSNGPTGISLLGTPNGDLDISMKGFDKSYEGTSLLKNRSSSLDSPNSLINSELKSLAASQQNITIGRVHQQQHDMVTDGSKLATSASNAQSILAPKGSGFKVIGSKVVSGSGAMTKVINASQGKNSPTSNILNNKLSGINQLSNSPAISSLNASLQACIEGSTDPDLSKLDERLVQILAHQRLQQLLPQKSATNSKTLLNGLLSNSGSNDVKARALMCPLTGKGQPVPMSYRSLTVGTGADMDVCLTVFGHCNYVSAKHTCIFYDETSRHFELLNYSEHGTTVDNVLYSCDFSEKAILQPKVSKVVKTVRGLIKKSRTKADKSKAKVEQKEEDKVTMSQSANKESQICSCRTSSSSLIGGSGAGWEGTALLHHGSYIKLGCIQFVFSIIDNATVALNPAKTESLLNDSINNVMPTSR
ncbi:unnamed protein product [Owenia fusiformis]|uniref:PHD finger protein 12 n=1 Tax=Owenia fusiformis TaxID=6347 RepID=A0A8J1XNS3_OWEFU|nr:unnamed protein product [Owenia fusiformis]